MVEPFIETDPITLISTPEGDRLHWEAGSPWVEMTCALLGPQGKMRAFMPSITVKSMGRILTLEEKFQGGTGIVNLTPPPESIVSSRGLEGAMTRAEHVANTLGLRGLARLDCFMHVETGELVVMEANTVPAMTPSTVLMHQIMTMEPPMYPPELFQVGIYKKMI